MPGLKIVIFWHFLYPSFPSLRHPSKYRAHSAAWDHLFIFLSLLLFWWFCWGRYAYWILGRTEFRNLAQLFLLLHNCALLLDLHWSHFENHWGRVHLHRVRLQGLLNRLQIHPAQRRPMLLRRLQRHQQPQLLHAEREGLPIGGRRTLPVFLLIFQLLPIQVIRNSCCRLRGHEERRNWGRCDFHTYRMNFIAWRHRNASRSTHCICKHPHLLIPRLIAVIPRRHILMNRITLRIYIQALSFVVSCGGTSTLLNPILILNRHNL